MRRAAGHWAAFLLSKGAVLSVAVAVQAFSEAWREQIDLTLQGRLSLSEYSSSVLRQLASPLQIDFYYRRGERMRARDLLELLVNESPRVHYELIDIDRNPLRAKQNGVRRFDRAVLFYEERELVTPSGTGRRMSVSSIGRIRPLRDLPVRRSRCTAGRPPLSSFGGVQRTSPSSRRGGGGRSSTSWRDHSKSLSASGFQSWTIPAGSSRTKASGACRITAAAKRSLWCRRRRRPRRWR